LSRELRELGERLGKISAEHDNSSQEVKRLTVSDPLAAHEGMHCAEESLIANIVCGFTIARLSSSP
jgi:hypothetical protein